MATEPPTPPSLFDFACLFLSLPCQLSWASFLAGGGTRSVKHKVRLASYARAQFLYNVSGNPARERDVGIYCAEIPGGSSF
eukprot:7745462-Pyramimonas_sp.AAC.1